jgi:hypothetical protein
VLYPRAKQALDRLSLLLDHPRGTRLPSVAIYGDSGIGQDDDHEAVWGQTPATLQSDDRNIETLPWK